MSGAVELIAGSIVAAWQGWTGPVVETSIFGTREPLGIAEQLDAWVRVQLGSPVARVHWYHASVGCTLAASLADGRDVVVKAHQPRFSGEYLRTMTRVQQHLVDHWYPCPTPVGSPAPLAAGGGAWATAASMRHDPGSDQRPDAVAAVAAFVRIAIEFDASAHLNLGVDVLGALSPHPLQAINPGDLYPEPYSPTFEYREHPQAEWIDRFARHARPVVDSDSTGQIVTHVDWSARNVRGSNHGVSDVFDMDSLALLPEARAVGAAAVSWHLDDVDADGVMSLADIEHFVWLYQRIRDRWFDTEEMHCVWAAVLWNLAYLARCEDAVGVQLSASRTLRTLGDTLVRRCGSA